MFFQNIGKRRFKHNLTAVQTYIEMEKKNTKMNSSTIFDGLYNNSIIMNTFKCFILYIILLVKLVPNLNHV